MNLASEEVVGYFVLLSRRRKGEGWGRCNHPPLPCSVVDVIWLNAWKSTKFNIIILYLVPIN